MKGRLLTIGSDPAAIVFVMAVVLVIALLLGAGFAARARRRRERRRDADWWMTPEGADQVAIARWVEEGRHLLTGWQERIERLDELQTRLAAMAQEIGRLKAQVSLTDELRAENLRLSQETEALSLERDQLRAVLARIGELIQRASEARPSASGDATPEVGP